MAKLILGIHNHQPVGNFDHVIRDAHERAYLPYLEMLERHPAIRCAVHISGPLYEWHKQETPEYLERLASLVKRGQVEMVGGGFWEPILAVLPERDQHAQIEKMCRELESRFGRRPRGLWLAERIWEPHLPRILAEHGLDWVALDDGHFAATGFTPEQLRGYFLTEEGGQPLAVFPISMRLRYLVPFHPVKRVIEHLGELDEGLGVLMDDGEKFGVWSSTNELCYGEGYLERLFSDLESSPSVDLTGFSNYLDSHPPLGSAYLPTASYTEMGEWALPAPAQARVLELAEIAEEADPALKPFVRGGFWRNFFVKYEESHWMHKRMLWTGRALAAARAEARLAPEILDEAEDLLLQAQCNCGYWHGLFGGLYLPHLRQAIFERLVKADRLIQAPAYDLQTEDLDLDGQQELIWSSPAARLFIKPRGGVVRELDYLERPFPFSNVLSRREETYHAKLRQLAAQPVSADGGSEAVSIHEIVTAKEEGLEAYLIEDPHPRAGLEEKLYVAGAEELDYCGAWLDFAEQLFDLEPPADPEGELLLSTELEFEPGRRLRLVKRLNWAEEGAALDVSLHLEYRGREPLQARFASGWNINLLAPDAPDRRVLVDGVPAADPRLRSRGREQGDRLELQDDWSGVRLALAGTGLAFYREPIETVSLSEAGFERVYQGSWICVNREIDLADGESACLRYRVILSPAN
jgi:4-alpha-glucanotransferase